MPDPITLPISHWAWSQIRHEEPRCTGTISEVSRDERWIEAECDGCVFPVAIQLPKPNASFEPSEEPF
jgi:hypothetical protein